MMSVMQLFVSDHSFFDLQEENPPMREDIQFYKHRQNWSNRMIAEDSLLVKSSLLHTSGLARNVQVAGGLGRIKPC